MKGGSLMKRWVHRFLSNDEGQDLIEYAMLATVVALSCTVGVKALGTAFGNVFTVIANQLQVSGP
jgi:Flp pilus assembly pilin Flp